MGSPPYSDDASSGNAGAVPVANGTSSAADIYAQVISTFNAGVIRIWGAEGASARLHSALMAFRLVPSEGAKDHPYESALSELRRIPYSSFDSLRYVRDVSHLIYATTLLDTFLTDTTLFLFLKFPAAMGKNQQVSLEALLATASRSEILGKTAARRAREISFLSFMARLDFLRDTFGLSIAIAEDVTKALEHYPSLRNAAVHDQGVFELTLNEAGELQSRKETCARHPTPVAYEDIHKAIVCYTTVSRSVAEAVMTHVLKQPDHPALEFLKSAAAEGESVGAEDSEPRHHS